MKLLKPNWVHHEDNPIFSIDVHPDSSRFATGGQGSDGGKIIIWNMGPVIYANQENDPKVPRVLCQMDHHIACVNVVRWSNNGLFLASGSDDKLIMIWHYASAESYQNIENWKCGYTLRGHSGDVLDLAWSSKDQYLASCSVDNTIIVWNGSKFPDIITRINAHNGFVKGVAWDPVGTFFASQSDDKTLKIWKTLDWSLEKSIEEPFKQCTGTTHILRLNWSPDGQLIISAHAINNSVPVAQVIDRSNKWSTKLDFVGHRKAVTAVRFYPQILKEDVTKSQKTYCLCAVGSRDRSISIWLTSYSRPLCVLHDLFDNPIMDLTWSKQPQPALLACSMDGTIAYVEFDPKEIGVPLSPEETETFFKEKYNCDINASMALKTSNVQQPNVPPSNVKEAKENVKFVENYDVLLAQEKKKENEIKSNNLEHTLDLSRNENSENFSSFPNTPSKQSALADNHKQIERRLPDGRRRITPICVSKPGEYDKPRPFVSSALSFDKHGMSSSIGFDSSSQFMSKTATEKSTIIVEKRDEKDAVLEVSPVKSVVYSKPVTFSTNSSNSSDLPKGSNMLEDKTTQVKNNDQKMDVDSDSAKAQQANTLESKVEPVKAQIVQLKPQTPKPNSETVASKSAKANIPVANQTPTNSLNKSAKPFNNKQTLNVSQSQNDFSKLDKSINNKQKVVITNKVAPVTNNTSTAVITQSNNNNQVAKKSTEIDSDATRTVLPAELKTTQISNFLEPLKADLNSNTKIVKIDGKKYSLEIKNGVNMLDKQANSLNAGAENDYQLNLMKLYDNDKTLKWKTCFLSKICDASCNKYFVACVCDDSTLNLIKISNGAQICCPIVLDSKVAVLHSTLNLCMCITVAGFVYVWKYELQERPNFNFDSAKKSSANDATDSYLFNLNTLISHLDCRYILKEGNLNRAFLTDTAIPVIQMSSNRSYFYSMNTKCWHLLPVNGNLTGDKVHLLLNSSTVFGNSSKNMVNYETYSPLEEIQSRHKSSNILKAIEMMNKVALNQSESFGKNDYTIIHLESQLNAAIGLDSPKEYKFWLLTYSRYLVENEYQEKLSELCNSLLGPMYSMNWNDTIMIYKKRDLLKEILPIIAQNINLQRLYSNYKRQLNIIESISTKSSVLDRINMSSNQVPKPLAMNANSNSQSANRIRPITPQPLLPTTSANGLVATVEGNTEASKQDQDEGVKVKKLKLDEQGKTNDLIDSNAPANEQNLSFDNQQQTEQREEATTNGLNGQIHLKEEMHIE